MCRFLVYKGRHEILLSNLILSPSHSILTQSYDSRLRLDTRRPHNGDGFGLGFYTPASLGPDPCIFTSTIPAWNCINLERLANKTESRLVFAHVRATTEGNLSEQNCHPFACGSLMWMHNGGVGGWKHIKRKVALTLREEWFNFVQGGTDSEWCFAIFLDTLETMGFHPLKSAAATSDTGFGHTTLRKAMLKTIARINAFVAEIPGDVAGWEETRSLLNFAVSDGHAVVCTRYVSSKTDEAASLFFSSGTDWTKFTTSTGETDWKMERRDKGADIVLVASEPLTFERDSWVTVPTNSILTIHRQTVMIHPIVDEYWSVNPSHVRSTQFAQTKGQTTTNGEKEVVANGKGGGVDARELREKVEALAVQ